MTQPTPQNQLFAELDRLGIPHRTITHVPVFTVEDAKLLRDAIDGGHTKNLFLKDRQDRLYLAVTLEDVPVDLNALAKDLAASRLSFASPALLRHHLGVEPGSVTPFALLNDQGLSVTPVLDETMLAADPLNFHPLVNTATTAIKNTDLLRFIEAQGHIPRRLRFPRRSLVGIS